MRRCVRVFTYGFESQFGLRAPRDAVDVKPPRRQEQSVTIPAGLYVPWCRAIPYSMACQGETEPRYPPARPPGQVPDAARED